MEGGSTEGYEASDECEQPRVEIDERAEMLAQLRHDMPFEYAIARVRDTYQDVYGIPGPPCEWEEEGDTIYAVLGDLRSPVLPGQDSVEELKAAPVYRGGINIRQYQK